MFSWGAVKVTTDTVSSISIAQAALMVFLIVEISAVGGIWAHLMHQAWKGTLNFNSLMLPDLGPIFRGRVMACNIGVAYIAFELIRGIFLFAYLPAAINFVARIVMVTVVTVSVASFPLVYCFYLGAFRQPSYNLMTKIDELIKRIPSLMSMGFWIAIFYLLHWVIAEGGLFELVNPNSLGKMLTLVGSSTVILWAMWYMPD